MATDIDKWKYADTDPDKLRADLTNKFDDAKRELSANTDYYNAEYRPDSVGVGTPPQLRKLMSRVGWARLYVDAIAERLDLEGFRMAGETSSDDRLWQWWQSNFLDVDSSLGHTEALIHGRAYITVSAPDPDNSFGVDPEMPIIRVESPTALWAEIDPLTRKAVAAVRPISDQETGRVLKTTVYTPFETIHWVSDSGQWVQEEVVSHNLGVVPVVPLLNRRSIGEVDGKSAIIPEIRDAMDQASRTMMNMSSATELMGAPLRLIFGAVLDDLSNGGDPASTFEAYYANILAFEDPSGSATQLQAAELQNFVNAMQELTRQVAAYTGLPPQYLGNSADNPPSAEAIKASESRMVKTCERMCRLFGGAWEDAMRVAMLVMGEEISPASYRMETLWRDPSTPTYASKADAASKLYANGEGVIPLERARIDMGYTVEERKEMKKWDDESPLGRMAGMYGPVDEGGADDTGGIPEEAA